MTWKLLAFHAFWKLDNTNMDNVQTAEGAHLQRDSMHDFALLKIEIHILLIYPKSLKQFQV
jgi:hypothetical protein